MTRVAIGGAAVATMVALLAAHAPAESLRIGADAARAWHPDTRAARSYAERRAGKVSFAVFDMEGRLDHWGGGARYAMASTFKVMLMVAYLRSDPVDDQRLRAFDKELLRPMIRRSDNESATRIRDMLGRGPIERLADRAGMRHFAWNDVWGHCRTSARDQAFFMRTLRRYVPERHWDFAKRQLAHIVGSQRWGFGQAKPDGWKLYFKGGWGSGTGLVDHQIALLTREGRRVGVAVMTEGNPSHEYGKETLEEVAERLLRGLPR
jgi:hypothetical protein